MRQKSDQRWFAVKMTHDTWHLPKKRWGEIQRLGIAGFVTETGDCCLDLADEISKYLLFVWIILQSVKDGAFLGIIGRTSCTETGRGTATACGTWRTTTTTTAPRWSPASTGTGPSSLPGSIPRPSTARVIRSFWKYKRKVHRPIFQLWRRYERCSLGFPTIRLSWTQPDQGACGLQISGWLPSECFH